MLVTIADLEGKPLDAKIELEPETIILHSRGGAFGKPNLRNPDHRKALRVILQRLSAGGMQPSGVWLDSQVAQSKPEANRQLVAAEDFALGVDELVRLIGQRGAAWGRPEGATGHGNSTKRVRIAVPGASVASLRSLLRASNGDGPRLPAATQRLVEAWMIDAAIDAFKAGAEHNFHGSRDYDLLLPSGERLPPKAIFGLALGQVIGRAATPADFSAGWGQPCFDIIEKAGYPIVSKSEAVPALPAEADDERSWAEGSPKRVNHLRRERAPNLARTKKRHFIEAYGHLFCERCGLVPSPALGPFGDACIEVHHSTVAVAQMDGKARTRLADLQCLCANCHRIVHREQL